MGPSLLHFLHLRVPLHAGGSRGEGSESVRGSSGLRLETRIRDSCQELGKRMPEVSTLSYVAAPGSPPAGSPWVPVQDFPRRADLCVAQTGGRSNGGSTQSAEPARRAPCPARACSSCSSCSVPNPSAGLLRNPVRGAICAIAFPPPRLNYRPLAGLAGSSTVLGALCSALRAPPLG